MSARRHTRGVALLTALLLVLLVSLLAAAGVRLSVASLRTTLNEELRMEAQHRAQSLIDATLAISDNTGVLGQVGDTNCLPGASGCTRNTLELPQADEEDYAGLADSNISVTVRRLGPDVAPPPRYAGYSAIRFGAAFMQVESRYDETASGQGRADLNEGVAAIVPIPGG